MNSKPDNRTHPPQTIFWALCFVIVALAIDYGTRVVALWQQRQELIQIEKNQAKNIAQLAQAPELEAKLRNLSIELVQLAATNATAKQIVKDFNIQWNPVAPSSATAGSTNVSEQPNR